MYRIILAGLYPRTSAHFLVQEVSVPLVSLQSHLKCVCVRQEASDLSHPHHAIQAHPTTQPADYHLRMEFLSSSPALPLAFLRGADTWQKDFTIFPDSPLHLHHQLLLSKPPSRAPPLEPVTCKSGPLDFTLERWWVEWWSVLPSDSPIPLPPPTHPPPPPPPALSVDVDVLGLSLINEMYDNVISLIEWHSLMVLCDYD